MNAYLEALRLGRWPRSLAIFSGVAAFAYLNRDIVSSFPLLETLKQSGLAFLLTWGISTANYVVNEIADAPYDIHHPTKRQRPLVRGDIRKAPFLAIGVILALASLGVGFWLFPRPFFVSLLALLTAGFLYNLKPFRTKDIPFLDSISESANNPIRFLIGWFAFSPSDLSPPWTLLAAWWLFGNFLMTAKRLSEFRLLRDKAEHYRVSLSRYSIPSLVFGIAISTVLFFAAYSAFALRFKLQSFFILAPFVLFYFFLIFWKTIREKEAMEEPESLMKHPRFAAYTLFLLILFVLSFFVDAVGTW